ncbi:hypothetical protein AURDEDRAFT_167383 [Auricularia subglabra TFB-10046 SS5]|nr:hypothetical protein AURDEDRAFT_167383 [Auricularia subglabra TFB-10046 SS5]
MVCDCPLKHLCAYTQCGSDVGQLCPEGSACSLFSECPAIDNPVEYCKMTLLEYWILKPGPVVRDGVEYNWDLVRAYSPKVRCSVWYMELHDVEPLQELHLQELYGVFNWTVSESPMPDDHEEAHGETTSMTSSEVDDEESSDMETPTTVQIKTTAAAPELPVTHPNGQDAAGDGYADEDDEMAAHL